MGIPSIDRATQNLVQWAARGEWEALQREFFEAHFEPVTDGLDLPDDAFEVLPDEGAGMLSVFVLEEFFTARFGTHGELNVVDDYLKRRGWRESAPARRYLEGLRDSTLSLYEVIDLVRGRHMTVRDLLLSDAPVRVEEKLGSQGAALWDRLTARIVPVHGKYLAWSSAGILPPPMMRTSTPEAGRRKKRCRSKRRNVYRKLFEEDAAEENGSFRPVESLHFQVGAGSG